MLTLDSPLASLFLPLSLPNARLVSLGPGSSSLPVESCKGALQGESHIYILPCHTFSHIYMSQSQYLKAWNPSQSHWESQGKHFTPFICHSQTECHWPNISQINMLLLLIFVTSWGGGGWVKVLIYRYRLVFCHTKCPVIVSYSPVITVVRQ